jgi:transcription termination factor 2
MNQTESFYYENFTLPPPPPSKIYNFAEIEVKLHQHQTEAQIKMKQIEMKYNCGGIIAHEPGCGKTITTAWYMRDNKIPNLPDLILCPVSLMSHWVNDIERVYPRNEKPKIIVFHGKEKNEENLKKNCDFIIAPHSCLGKNELAGKSFGRIAIDEAHVIKGGGEKNESKITKIAAGAYNLRGKFKWCLTGTPFNNNIFDLYALAKFNNSIPYSQRYWWVASDGSDIKSWKEEFVLSKSKDDFLMKPIYHDVIVTPTKYENSFVNKLRSDAEKIFDKWKVAQGDEKMLLQGTILSLITNLRICSDSVFCKYKDKKQFESREDEIVFTCKKSAKIIEIMKIVEDRLENDESKSVIVFSQFKTFLNILRDVFFLNFGEDTEVFLFDGSLNVTEKDRIVKKFTTMKTPRILLISLKAGGVGLNLIPCSTVILSEPWYNPFIEKQAEDRVHRIGQNRQVYVYRLTMDSSIERWIQGIKMSKLVKAGEAGIEDGDKMSKIMSTTFKMDDLKNLFSDCISGSKSQNSSMTSSAEES